MDKEKSGMVLQRKDESLVAPTQDELWCMAFSTPRFIAMEKAVMRQVTA